MKVLAEAGTLLFFYYCGTGDAAVSLTKLLCPAWACAEWGCAKVRLYSSRR
jgi:hypothetical protein